MTALYFARILKSTPEGGINNKWLKFTCIYLLIFFNLHLFTFGFAPRLHGYFELEKIYHAVRASMHRNALQVFIIITLIGLVAMNIHDSEQKTTSTGEEADEYIVEDDGSAVQQGPLWRALMLCVALIPLNILEVFMFVIWS